jgi:transcriptional regulator with XRE-family HTH domain
MTPGVLIRAVRRRHGLSQAELARRAGTSQPVVSAYEHGRRDPTYATLRRLIEASGERFEISARSAPPGLPPATSDDEHGKRLLDALSVADAVPSRSRGALLRAPRMISA